MKNKALYLFLLNLFVNSMQGSVVPVGSNTAQAGQAAGAIARRFTLSGLPSWSSAQQAYERPKVNLSNKELQMALQSSAQQEQQVAMPDWRKQQEYFRKMGQESMVNFANSDDADISMPRPAVTQKSAYRGGIFRRTNPLYMRHEPKYGISDPKNIFDAKNNLGLSGVDQPTEQQIKSAFKKLSLVHHPDVGGSEDSFKSLKKSEEMLLKGEPESYSTKNASRSNTSTSDDFKYDDFKYNDYTNTRGSNNRGENGYARRTRIINEFNSAVNRQDIARIRELIATGEINQSVINDLINLAKAIGRTDIFKSLSLAELLKEEYFNEAFDYAIETQDKAWINNLLSQIKDKLINNKHMRDLKREALLQRTYDMAIKNNDAEWVNFLTKEYGFQELATSRTIDSAIHNNDLKAIMDFAHAGKINDAIAKKLLMTSAQNGYIDLANKLLTTNEFTPETIAKAASWAASNKKFNVFQTLLETQKIPQEDILKIFDHALKNHNKEVVDALIATGKIDYYRRLKAYL